MNDEEILWERKPNGIPTIEVRIWMRRTSEGGRSSPLWRGYCPHLVAKGHDTMWGVCVLAITESPRPNIAFPGDEARLVCELIYHAPHFNYGELKRGVTFEIKEGPRTIGKGVVLDDFEG